MKFFYVRLSGVEELYVSFLHASFPLRLLLVNMFSLTPVSATLILDFHLNQSPTFLTLAAFEIRRPLEQ